MSSGSSKRIRRQVRKTSDGIVLAFLRSMEKENFATRIKLALRILAIKYVKLKKER